MPNLSMSFDRNKRTIHEKGSFREVYVRFFYFCLPKIFEEISWDVVQRANWKRGADDGGGREEYLKCRNAKKNEMKSIFIVTMVIYRS